MRAPEMSRTGLAHGVTLEGRGPDGLQMCSETALGRGNWEGAGQGSPARAVFSCQWPDRSGPASGEVERGREAFFLLWAWNKPRTAPCVELHGLTLFFPLTHSYKALYRCIKLRWQARKSLSPVAACRERRSGIGMALWSLLTAFFFPSCSN